MSAVAMRGWAMLGYLLLVVLVVAGHPVWGLVSWAVALTLTVWSWALDRQGAQGE